MVNNICDILGEVERCQSSELPPTATQEQCHKEITHRGAAGKGVCS